MPLIQSLHERVFKNEQQKEEDIFNAQLNQLISKVTFDILKDSPSLVADVANNLVNRSCLDKAIIKTIDKQNYHLLGLDREEVIKKVIDYMFGYGPLQDYIENDEISDIDITKYNEATIKIKGVRKEINLNFGSEDNFNTYCKLLAVRNKGILDENNTQCRVVDEKHRLRINISIRPRNVSGPSISIRKHKCVSHTLASLYKEGMFGNDLYFLLQSYAKKPLNIIICGKGGSGKTTLLRAIINEMPVMDRVLIVESDAEIYPEKKYCIEQRIKKANEGGIPTTLRELVRDGLTMSLDTYVVGEMVGDEAIEFIKAIHTGHRGLTTTHSISAEDALYRLVTLSKSANIGESEKIVKEMLGRSIDIVIHMKDFKVNHIIEVITYDSDKDKFITNTIYNSQKGLTNNFANTVKNL